VARAASRKGACQRGVCRRRRPTRPSLRLRPASVPAAAASRPHLVAGRGGGHGGLEGARAARGAGGVSPLATPRASEGPAAATAPCSTRPWHWHRATADSESHDWQPPWPAGLPARAQGTERPCIAHVRCSSENAQHQAEQSLFGPLAPKYSRLQPNFRGSVVYSDTLLNAEVWKIAEPKLFGDARRDKPPSNVM
jgi:hypothetical protein